MGRDRIRMQEQEAAKASVTESEESAQMEQVATSSPPTHLNARQNAVLRMQQTQGNAAVRRAMAEDELVQAKRDNAVQRAGNPENEEDEDEMVQAKRDSSIQRAGNPENEEDEDEMVQAKRDNTIQRQASAEGGPIDDQITGQINTMRGGGQSLDSGVAQRMESSMGADFSGVRVHTDDTSHQLNQSLSAKAFTTGQDIFFQKGAYQPGSGEGQQLLAHELTHVVQQGGSAPSGPLTLGPAHDSYEAEADSVSNQVTSGAEAPSAQREEDDSIQRKALVQRHAEHDDEAAAH